MPPSLVLAAVIAALAPVQKASPTPAVQPVPRASPTPAGQPVQKATTAPSPAPPASSPAADPQQPARRFTALVLRNEGIALDGLAAALALRIPDLPVVAESPRDGAPFVFIAVRSDPATPVRHQLGVITSDGAAYFREVDTGADPPARVIASVLANLLVSIAEGSVQPDRTDVPIPPPETPLPEPEPEPEPEPFPTPPPPEPTPAPVPKTSPVPTPRWDYGLVLAGLVDLAGPPRFGAVLGGGGGSLGLDIRGRQGALLGLELRGLGRGVAERSLVRLRIAALAGYALRRGRFEMPIALGISVEPWWVDPTITNRPLLGALVRASPGLYLARPRGPLRALRVGPRIELAGSFVVDDGPRVAAISQASTTGNTPQLRLGGLEINLGLELTLWFGRPARAPSPALRPRGAPTRQALRASPFAANH
ncbi:hypothetical protein [Nannocystis sp.]|uniref:hypothetical protein n=1 Tax=Nannocystis sp. TaxID=1962667 RepID=UPI0025D0FD2B|nr:hypothetical protein [Nannocystis sp.]MBK7828020.1 hypothetical protein [Nannocystis sp.]